MQAWVMLDLCQEGGVLSSIVLTELTTMRTQEFIWPNWVRRVPCNGVELVVAHDCHRTLRINHAPHGHHAVDLPGLFAIYKITDKNGCTTWMSVGTTFFTVAEMLQKRVELASLTMDVPNDVVRHIYLSVIYFVTKSF